MWWLALKRLTRPARSIRVSLGWSRRQLAIAAAIAIAVFLFGMILIDAAGIKRSAICRAG